MAKAIMIQGAGSNVGKSLIVAGLARAYHRRGLRVAPFKPQNMSNNAAATADGGEIGRAQALQARAACLAPSIHMNPVLLKPETETGAQVIVQGQRWNTMRARDYGRMKGQLLPKVLDSFTRISAEADLVIVEGAGSPAEINLRAGDIANMGFAEAANVPVLLVGDIDRGGVIAQLVGTHAVLAPEDCARIVGFAINKFRGDPSLFDAGYSEIANRTGWRGVGVCPYFDQAWRLPAEDVMDLTGHAGGPVKIAVPRLNRIANFDDLDPLKAEPDITLDLVEPGRPLPRDAALILLPGSKSTIADLVFLRAQGWDIDIAAHHRQGGHVLGICGGYQMLGRSIADPEGIEGPPGSVAGLGLLNIDTVMHPRKNVGLRHGVALGQPVEGYEIHIGDSTGPDRAHAWLEIDGLSDGAASADGRVRGTYLHGIFSADAFRAVYLAQLGAQSQTAHESELDATLDALADHMERHLDLNAILELAGAV